MLRYRREDCSNDIFQREKLKKCFRKCFSQRASEFTLEECQVDMTLKKGEGFLKTGGNLNKNKGKEGGKERTSLMYAKDMFKSTLGDMIREQDCLLSSGESLVKDQVKPPAIH